MKSTILINLYAGPGTGKSTTAAGVFSLLKLHGINAELVTEFAKDLTWEDRETTLKNQYYIWGKQHHRLFRVASKVDVIVTDSPLLLSIVYSNYYNNQCREFNDLVMLSHQSFNNIDFFLKRVKEYNPAGRSQTEEGAIELDTVIKKTLNDLDIAFTEVDGNWQGINYITLCVLKMLSKTPKFNIEMRD